jgi:hypothetical protein
MSQNTTQQFYEQFHMPCSGQGNRIILTIPRPLTHEDMDRFRKWIDLIEDAIVDDGKEGVDERDNTESE